MAAIRQLCAIAIALFSVDVAADAPRGTGERIANDAMALVSFSEFGNIGARDPDCRGTAFPTSDVSNLVDGEIAPVLRALGRSDPRFDSKRLDEMIAMLKRLPQTQQEGMSVVLRLYQQRKREATTAFGISGRCAALSSQVQTVMHQKRMGLRDADNLLRQGR